MPARTGVRVLQLYGHTVFGHCVAVELVVEITDGGYDPVAFVQRPFVIDMVAINLPRAPQEPLLIG